MKVLFIGDVMAEPGLRVIAKHLPALRVRNSIDVVIANAENIAQGAGMTRTGVERLFASGVDVLTNGNHVWDKAEALDLVAEDQRLLRPHNFPDGTPGSGWTVVQTRSGEKLGILSVMGSVHMYPQLGCPFRAADAALASKDRDVKLVFVDIHAEHTSEKLALAWYLDGRVSAIVGTHTHVPTADERILPKGSAYLTDVGMTCCYDSVVGLDIDKALQRFIHKIPARFDVVDGPATLCAVIIDLDADSGRALSIERIRVEESAVVAG